MEILFNLTDYVKCRKIFGMAPKKRQLSPDAKGMIAAIPPDDLAILERRIAVSDCWAQGLTGEQTAERLGISRETVYADRQSLKLWWREQAVAPADDLLARELMQIDTVIREAWHAWRQSLKDSVTETKKDGANGVETTIAKRGQSGDPAHLNAVLKAVEMRARLLRLIDKGPRVNATQINIGDSAADVAKLRREFAALLVENLGVDASAVIPPDWPAEPPGMQEQDPLK